MSYLFIVFSIMLWFAIWVWHCRRFSFLARTAVLIGTLLAGGIITTITVMT